MTASSISVASAGSWAQPESPSRPRVGAALGVILACVGVSYLVFVPRLVFYALHGRWSETSGAAASAPEFFLLHVVTALTMLTLFVVQPLSGPGVVSRKRWVRALHRQAGRLFVGSMLLGNLFGLLIMVQHFFFHTGTLMGLVSTAQVAVVSSIFYVAAVWAIRRRDLAGHLENLVFASLVVTTPAIYRVAEDMMVLVGYDHPRAKYMVSVLGTSIQSNDLMLIINQLTLVLAWLGYAGMLGRVWAHPAKLAVCGVAAAACLLTLIG